MVAGRCLYDFSFSLAYSTTASSAVGAKQKVPLSDSTTSITPSSTYLSHRWDAFQILSGCNVGSCTSIQPALFKASSIILSNFLFTNIGILP